MITPVINPSLADLEKQLLARIVGNLTPPQVGIGLHGDTASISPEKQNSKQSPLVEVSEKEFLLLKLFGEFTRKDEGKVLASELGKFARFVQSEVAKSSTKEVLSS